MPKAARVPAKNKANRRRGLACAIAATTCAFLASRAFAGPFDLEDDTNPKPPSAAADAGLDLTPPTSHSTIKAHAYTLAECLALADRNHPALWAQRAKLGFVHAQVDEAKWTPFSQWNLSTTLGIAPPVGGTLVYSATPLSALSFNLSNAYQPALGVDLSGVIPLYTFGKITAVREAAEANVRVNEWDLEKSRAQTRMDVRKAFFGLMFARDAQYVLDDVDKRLNDAVDGMSARLAKGEKGIDETDRLKLEVYRAEINSRSGDPKKGQTFAIAALRYMTGVQSGFDIPDVPLKRPPNPLAPVVSYLTAARLFRPEVNMARAGVVARQAQVNLARANFFPDIGLGLDVNYAVAPSVPANSSALAGLGANHFFLGGGIGLKWGLDFIPKSAKLSEAQSQLEETRALERRALGEIAVEVETTYANAVEANSREEAWDRAEHIAKQWIATVQGQIESGAKEEGALTDPLRAYINARVNHLQSLWDLNVTESDLARASGWDASAPTGE